MLNQIVLQVICHPGNQLFRNADRQSRALNQRFLNSGHIAIFIDNLVQRCLADLRPGIGYKGDDRVLIPMSDNRIRYLPGHRWTLRHRLGSGCILAAYDLNQIGVRQSI